MNDLKTDCAFQYFDGIVIQVDEINLTLEDAKDLWNRYYEDMVYHAKEGYEIEVAIWINMQNGSDYTDTLIHLCAPQVKNGILWEPKYFRPFKRKA